MSVIAAILRPDSPVGEAEIQSLAAAGSPLEGAAIACRTGDGFGLAARTLAGPAAAAEDDGLVAVLDGRIDNRRELARALGRGENAAGGDAGLVLAAYRKWGKGCPPRLVGDFAFILWDARRHRLLCARDALGLRPLHYARAGGALVVATEAQQLLACCDLPREPDRVMLVCHLLGLASEPDRSWFEAVQALPPGALLSADPPGERVERYWDPAAIQTASRTDPGAAVERFGALFERAVGDRLPAAGGACGVLLGGGLDSSAVAASAADQVAAAGHRQPMALYNISFEQFPECDEGAFVEALSARLALPVERIAACAEAVTEEWREHPPAVESPISGWQGPVREILRRLRQRGGTVLLTGHGGDSVVAGSAEVYADRLRRGEFAVLREMLEHSRASGMPLAGLIRYWGLRPLLPAAVRRAFALRGASGRVPDWIDPDLASRLELRRRVRDSLRLPPAASRAEAVIRGQIRDLGRALRSVHWLGRVAAESGLEVRHPFLDRRLVELVLSTPPALHFSAGRYKQLLRQSVGQRLPPLIRDRLGKTSFGPFLEHSWRQPGAGAIRSLLASTSLARMGIVRGDLLRRDAEQYLQGRSNRLRPYLWAVVTAELWLEQLGRRPDPHSDSIRLPKKRVNLACGS